MTTITRKALAVFILATSLTATAPAAGTGPQVAVAPQYDTTHVYVSSADVDAFVKSFVATFGGQSTPQVVATVTPTPSRTTSQLIQTPVGTVSVFGFQTGVPYPFGAERNGYLVTDLDEAVKAARAAGADVLVSPFPDPIGRDVVVQWPGGVNLQLYWHTKTPSYAAFQTVPENRVYLSTDRATAFVHSFTTFAHGKVVSDVAQAPGVEIGRPADTYRRIRIESAFGKMVVIVTDGHVPYPYGRETTGYEVADLAQTLTQAQAAKAHILVAPFNSGQRAAAVVEFPGGYIAEIHGPALDAKALAAAPKLDGAGGSTVSHADIERWVSAWNSHDIDTVMALFTPDVIINQPSNPKPLDEAHVRAFFSMIFKAYPDFHVDLMQGLVDGDTAISIERVTGTWSGPYTDPATGSTTPGNGRKFDHPGVMRLVYAAEHKISRVDIYWDRLTVDQQLGLVAQ